MVVRRIGASPPRIVCLPIMATSSVGRRSRGCQKAEEVIHPGVTEWMRAIIMVNGEQFVTVASGGGERGRRGGDLILSFALPQR